MQTWDRVKLWVVCALFAMLRIAGIKSPAFQAFSHLWVGALIGVWRAGVVPSRECGWLAVVLSVIELACFLVQHSR